MSADNRKPGWVRAPRLASGALLVILAAAPAAWAHTDPTQPPPGATQTGAGQLLGVFTDAGCSQPLPAGMAILECQTVWLQSTLLWTGLPSASFEGGRWRLLANTVEFQDLGAVSCVGDPVNSQNDPAAPGGRGACLGAPSSFPSACVPYTPSAADIAAGTIVFESVYGDPDPMNPDTAFAHLGVGDLGGVSVSTPNAIQITECPEDECNTGDCDPGTLECIPVAESTPCGDTDQNLCTLAGCELDPENSTLGVCVQTHGVVDCPTDECNLGCDPGTGECTPEEESTVCTDTDGDLCTTAGCELDPGDPTLGICVQAHTTVACPGGECNVGCDPSTGECGPVAPSTPCTDTDGDLCTLAGCEPDPVDPNQGICVQTHTTVACPGGECNLGCDPGTGECTPEQPSTACGDTDGNLCTLAGCELDPNDPTLGVCVQDHSAVDCPVDECNLGCDPGTGDCTPEEESTVCTDTDPADGICAGCELDPADPTLGVCVQDHIDSPECVPTLGEVGLAAFALVLLLGSAMMFHRRRLSI